MTQPLECPECGEESELDLDAAAGHYAQAVSDGHDGLADWWAARLDRADADRRGRLSSPTLLGDSAAYLASRGLHVFPLTPGSKRPLPGHLTCCGGSHRRGCTDALANVHAARAWWQAHPTANIGLATGHVVDVLDVDGAEGTRWWLRGEDWPPTLGVVSTPRDGGVHVYVAATGHGNGTKIAPGLDWRGRGGYVLAPPSVIDGRRYSWIRPLELTRSSAR